MSQLKFPQSDRARLNLLLQATRVLSLEQNAAGALIQAATRDQILTFTSNYEARLSTYQLAKAERAEAIRVRNEAREALCFLISDFYNNVKRQARLLELPDSVLSQYQLTQSGRRPVDDEVESMIFRAHQLAQADARAESFGMRTQTNPSAAELTAAADVLAEAEFPAIQARFQVQSIQAELNADARDRAARLIHRLRDELRMNLRGYPRSYQREVMRQFGFTFSGPPAGATFSTPFMPKPLALVQPVDENDPTEPEEQAENASNATDGGEGHGEGGDHAEDAVPIEETPLPDSDQAADNTQPADENDAAEDEPVLDNGRGIIAAGTVNDVADREVPVRPDDDKRAKAPASRTVDHMRTAAESVTRGRTPREVREAMVGDAIGGAG